VELRLGQSIVSPEAPADISMPLLRSPESDSELEAHAPNRKINGIKTAVFMLSPIFLPDGGLIDQSIGS
jgi:hypothetical protein